jgi:hypothetical protein
MRNKTEPLNNATSHCSSKRSNKHEYVLLSPVNWQQVILSYVCNVVPNNLFP